MAGGAAAGGAVMMAPVQMQQMNPQPVQPVAMAIGAPNQQVGGYRVDPQFQVQQQQPLPASAYTMPVQMAPAYQPPHQV